MNRLGAVAVPLYLAGFVVIPGTGRWVMMAQAIFMVIGLIVGRREPNRSDGVFVLALSSGLAVAWGLLAPDARVLAGLALAATMIYTGLMAPRPFAEWGLGVVPVVHLAAQLAGGPEPAMRWQIVATTITSSSFGLLLFAVRITTERQLNDHLEALAVANDRLERLNRTDPLTGLANRRGLEELLADAWALDRDAQRPVGMLMIDIDHFKKYNDHYGHPGGDRCLQRIASALAGGAPGADLVARYGGEEFAVVLLGADAGDAVRVAERVRHAVADLCLEHAAAPSGVLSVSIGAASARPGDCATAADLVRRADDALYEAKRAGRDRVGAGLR